MRSLPLGCYSLPIDNYSAFDIISSSSFTMYLSEAFNDSAYLHMQMEFSGDLGSLELCSKRWLLF